MARILVLVADGFDDQELQGLTKALREDGQDVVRVGPKRGETVTGKGGQEVQVDLDPLQVNHSASHVVVVPGGPGADKLVENSQMVNVVYSMAHKGRIVVAVGRGVRMLPPVAKQKSPNPVATGTKVLQGDLLKGRLVTGDAEARQELEKAGAHWSDGPVVTDLPLVTARSARGDDLGLLLDELAPLLPLAEQPVVSQIL